MAVERNIDGLRNSAEKKRQQSFEKFEFGIGKLLRNKDKINFNSVAETSGLSRAWLYKESEVKARIEQLREQTEKTKKVPLQQKPSDSSKDVLIKTLKVRLKKVEAKNQGLKRQLEVVYDGQMSYGKMLKQKIKCLEDENKKLKGRLYAPVSNYASEKKVVEIKSSRISQRIIVELNRLEVKPTSTLVNKIRGASEKTVLIAIEALKEQMDLEIVKKPEAWLSKAIANSWQPNKDEIRKKINGDSNTALYSDANTEHLSNTPQSIEIKKLNKIIYVARDCLAAKKNYASLKQELAEGCELLTEEYGKEFEELFRTIFPSEKF